jgi:hypothetical protein
MLIVKWMVKISQMTELNPTRQNIGYLILIISFLLFSCQEKSFMDNPQLLENPKIITFKDTDSTIYITDNIIIKDKGKVRDTLYSYSVFENFLKKLINSNRFLFVPLKDLNSTFSSDKVIISIRHDIDYDINSSVRFARREHDLGIRATYFILHTADYYSKIGRTPDNYVKVTNSASQRNPHILPYIKKIQDEYDHEIGWHNDLVTLQVVYNIDAGKYLSDELKWLRQNNIKIEGTSSHGSEYCYKYHYLNAFFWQKFRQDDFFYNNEYVMVNGKSIKIQKHELSDFDFKYDANLLSYNRVFADVFLVNNKQWHMRLEKWNELKPGDKVVIIIHPALWDSY